MSSKLMKRIVIGVILVLIGIQFIRPSRKIPVVDPNAGFIALANPPADIANMIQTACYDCHSYATKYPWYANVAPISWWIGNHVREGREHLNFMEWGRYNFKEQAQKAGECHEEIAEGHMPISNYTWMHAGARLNDAQREALVAYFQELETVLRDIPPMPILPPQ